MSKPKKKVESEEKPEQTELASKPEPAQPSQPAPAPEKQDALTIMATQLEEMRAEFKRTTNTLAEAIVKINEKVEGKAAAGGGSGDALSRILDNVMRQPTVMPIEDFAKQAEAIAKAADAIDRFRVKSPIGAGEALLMRAGMRAALPRYMTKHELERYEKALGLVPEPEEGSGHVTE